ncbi:hypothetical protein K435DRAFT_964354 [Dendrothele bispora CBS 962.96]|uniref:F-box domain-containing protein n=1 Tax=Dendrothele bispora (strain CBS 962.96) TaxID=1314807 RepID=A0A4S8MB64_DENBC|nr:hypothetical protein K435DRAFT_964354 [Dendrothele bispora CBS 962.96]
MSCFLALMANSFPPELKSRVATHCSAAVLASLIRVDKSYQAGAEPILYRHIILHAGTRSAEILLNTLNSIPSRKPSFVRSLIVRSPQHHNHADDQLESISEALCNALSKMQYLSDLRFYLASREIELQNHVKSLLCSQLMRLHIFHCTQYFDIPTIACAQSSTLKTLGMESGDIQDLFHVVSTTVNELDSRGMSKPVMFAYECDGYLPVFDVLTVFPDMLAADFSWQPILESYDSNNGSIPTLSREHVYTVNILLKDLFSVDQKFIGNLVEEMSEFFPSIHRLEFISQQPSPLWKEWNQYSNFVSIISPLTELNELGFHDDLLLTEQIQKRKEPSEQHFLFARNCSAACPKLRSIGFLRGPVLERDVEKGEDWQQWKAFYDYQDN